MVRRTHGHLQGVGTSDTAAGFWPKIRCRSAKGGNRGRRERFGWGWLSGRLGDGGWRSGRRPAAGAAAPVAGSTEPEPVGRETSTAASRAGLGRPSGDQRTEGRRWLNRGRPAGDRRGDRSSCRMQTRPRQSRPSKASADRGSPAAAAANRGGGQEDRSWTRLADGDLAASRGGGGAAVAAVAGQLRRGCWPLHEGREALAGGQRGSRPPSDRPPSPAAGKAAFARGQAMARPASPRSGRSRGRDPRRRPLDRGKAASPRPASPRSGQSRGRDPRRQPPGLGEVTGEGFAALAQWPAASSAVAGHCQCQGGGGEGRRGEKN
ncbi:hypothetical protein BT93_L1281 [Corymbia citriodora subsp. variegata]|uniref:Uncharacterized protein n=1 Tax=Corymbia citriodora subsp. variegata TaxID=360336 RepID=A0A8T0CSZ6_CORYI|nr:hypothetical protein BT93_L1281 [Corymbia citriodora subsp. variegata]